MPDIKSDKSKILLLIILWLIHGGVAILLYPPFFEKETWAGSSSALALVVSFALAVWFLGLLILAVLRFVDFWRKPGWDSIFSRSRNRDGLALTAAGGLLVSICLWVIYGLSASTPDSLIDNYLRIIEPLLHLSTFVCLEFLIVVLWMGFPNRILISKGFLLKFGGVFILLGFLALLVMSTRLGIVPSYRGDWSRGLPAVPLFEWHILTAIVFMLGIAMMEMNKRTESWIRSDWLICVLIWCGASLLWISQPTVPNASALKPHEPNFEIYPFLDAQTYDQVAQSVLIGDGFNDGIPQRPLYITFLAISHVLVGQSYEAMIFFQSLVFALFPVLLYIFGARFMGRPVGIAMAILAILRDFSSNFVAPFTGNLSYTKVLLSEIPTAIFLVLLLIMGHRWIKQEFPVYLAFLMGGALGIGMLVRTQVGVALPVLILFGLLVQPKRIRSLMVGVFVMALSMLLVIGPWLWRNWQLTGDVIFDNPESQVANLALRYGRLNGVESDITQLPGETYAAYNERLRNMSMDAISSHPEKALWGVTNSLLNHGVNNILLFPLRYELADIHEFFVPRNAFWETWEGQPSALQSVLLIFYLVLFGLGLTVAWHHQGWLGLMPFGLNLVYNLWTSIALLSGQRFMLSMDWAVYFYFMTGIFTLLGGFLMLLTKGYPLVTQWIHENSAVLVQPARAIRPGAMKYLFAGLFFISIGILLPLVEKTFPDRYPFLSDDQIFSRVLSSSSFERSGIGPACFQQLEESGILTYQQGRALYPRYYSSGDGEPFTDAVGYKPVAENRIVFEVIGKSDYRVVFPVEEEVEFLPQAADVLLVYGNNSTLWFIFAVQNGEEGFYVSKDFDRSICR